jgi:agmatine deiminase
MLRFFLLFTFISLGTFTFSQEPLPKGMTPAERLVWDEYLKNYPTSKGTNPPAKQPRTPSEWDEAQGVIITWAAYTSNLREIVRHAKEVVKVYIVCGNPSNVQNYLAQGGISADNIEFITANFNSVWVRDYGPQSIYLSETNELAFVDWIYNRPRPYDDVIPSVMANHMNLPIYQMTEGANKLIATGGNFMTDGYKQGFSSNLILSENNTITEAQIDTIKKRYMGIEPYIKMTTLPYDGIHHIDMHMKLLDEETLLVGEYPTGVADGPQIEANLSYILNNYRSVYGTPFRVVRIPMPPDETGKYPPYSDYLTYTNSIILNNLVLVPIYGLSQDNQALEIYRDAMPGYKVVGINMRNVIPASGAIHCITREIAANDPIFINHAPIRGNVTYSLSGYRVDAFIETQSGVQEASLYWTTDIESGFNHVPMWMEQDTFRAIIPKVSGDTEVHYFISVTNWNGKTISKPIVGEDGPYTFYTPKAFHSLSVGIEGIGDTNPPVGLYRQAAGSILRLEATSSSGWDFRCWYINGVEYSSPVFETTVTTDIEAIAKFVLTNTYYSLSVEIDGEGSTNPHSGVHEFLSGSEVTLSASPSNGWAFESWEINRIVYSSSEVTTTISEDVTAIATFVEISSVAIGLTSGLKAHPNPTSGLVWLKLPKKMQVNGVAIVNIAGNDVLYIPVDDITDEFQVDLSSLKSGIYILRIRLSNDIIATRVAVFNG